MYVYDEEGFQAFFIFILIANGIMIISLACTYCARYCLLPPDYLPEEIAFAMMMNLSLY